MKLVQYRWHLFSPVDTDNHQDIGSHSTEYVPMRFQLFMG